MTVLESIKFALSIPENLAVVLIPLGLLLPLIQLLIDEKRRSDKE